MAAQFRAAIFDLQRHSIYMESRRVAGPSLSITASAITCWSWSGTHCNQMPEGRRAGEEKTRELLAYLREPPEELRPVSRKLL